MFKRTFDTQPSIENKSESLSLAPGKSYTFNISFPSPSNVGCASYYIHKVSVKSKTYDPIRKNNSFTSNGPRVVCDDEADISVDMTGPNSVAQGDLVTYSLTVRNDGPNDATNVFLSSLYNNPQLRFKEAMGVSCLADTDGITVRCGPFDLLAGDEGRLITLIFETPENMRCDIPIINSASVQTFDQRDPDLGNNRSRSVHTTVECDPEPASLKVTVKHIGTEDVAVVGQKNINLLRFEATTGEADDILLIAARFRAQEGQTSNIQNYSLWADTDDDGEVDTILEDGVSHNVVAGVGITVEFNSLAGGGYVVPAEQTAVFEVHGDVASSLGEIPSLRLRFMTEGNYVEAEELDSGTSIEGISLNAVPSILWRFVTQLEPVSLSVTVKDIGTEDVAVAGQKNINLFRLEARAGTEDLLLTRARFIANEGETTNVQNYTLWVDTDHNGVVDIILERGVSSMIGVIEFDGLAGGGYVIPAGNKAVFEVHGDVASSLSPNPTLRLQFMEQGEYLNAEGLDDGTALVGIETNGSCNGINECQISVTTQDSILWKFM